MNDSVRGNTEKFEDFLVTAIGDLPEIDIVSATGVTTAIVAASGTEAEDGWVELPVGSSNDDDVAAVSFGALNFFASVDIEMEARVRISATTDNKFFIGFGDSIASADETSFSRTAGTLTIDTMSDAIGFAFDQDDTTPQIVCAAGKADAVTLDAALGTTYNLTAGEPAVFKVYVAAGAKFAQFYINGKLVYTANVASALITTTAGLTPGVWHYEQATAADLEVDYLYSRKARGNG